MNTFRLNQFTSRCNFIFKKGEYSKNNEHSPVYTWSILEGGTPARSTN